MKIGLGILPLMLILSLAAVSFSAADADLSASEKKKIKATMVEYIKANSTRNENFLLLDSRAGKTLSLKFGEVHKGVEKHADGFLACVDMLEGKTIVDVDFIVSKEGEDYRVSKIAIHKVDGSKRKGHLDH